MEHFVAGTTARCAGELSGVNRNTARYYYHRLRQLIVQEMEREETKVWGGEVEVDESYFGGRRKGKRGRGAAGKVPVFGILKRGGRVYTKVVLDTQATTLLPIIKGKVKPDSIVYSDGFCSDDTLYASGFRHLRINHAKAFSRRENHINGIENFWNQAKRHMRRFNGI